MPPNTPTPCAEPTAAIPQWDAARVALCLAVLPVWTMQLTVAVERSAQAVSDMLGAFSELAPVLEGVSATDPGMGALSAFQANIERMYAGFQYQDRLSQALGLIQVDMTRLALALRDELPSPDTLESALWLGRMESEYVMVEQHDPHAPRHGSADEVTFF